MYFKRIELQGFKSFAEPVSIEFQEGITCIVGPNGSGKSNISDAIRWVLGEQSPKMLRGGKMEEVIFAGTASRKSRGMAEVTLVMDNSTHFLPIDYTEVAITRRMYRSGESEYLINKIPCRLRDIRELIMDTGIGVDGYSIIGQGKIVDIVGNKPESRREIFEEAAGIVKYRTRKAEAERKLETSRGNLDRVSDIIGEIEYRIGSLAEDSRRAKEYLKLRERFQEIEINIILKNLETIESKNRYIQEDIEELDKQLAEKGAEKIALDAEVQEKQARSEELEAIAAEKQDRLVEAASDLSRLSGEHRLRGQKEAAIEKDLLRIAGEMESLVQKREKEEQNARQVTEERKKLQELLAERKAELAEKQKAMEEISREAEAASRAVDEQKDRIYELHRYAASKNSEMGSLKGMGEALSKRKDQVFFEKESSETAGSGLLASWEKTGKEREERGLALEKRKAEKAEKTHLYEEARRALGELRSRMEKARMELGQTSARRKVISEMESAYEGYNHGVKFIMKSGLPGLHGVVAELMEVPSGFETAVETALGAAVQNVVCEDDESAKKAVALLKKNRAGRLTFLPLSSIRASAPHYDPAIEKQEGFQGFGVDCITFDPKYRKVMEYLLGRVVIVDRLDSAVKLSKKAGGGLRFVTLEGEVINAGGAITGGAFRTNTAGLLERKAEARQLDERVRQLERAGKDMEQQLAASMAEGEKAKAEIAALDEEIRNLELELLGLDKEISDLSRRQAEMNEIRAKWDRELSSIQKEEMSAAAMIQELASQAEEAQREIDAAQRLAEEGLARYEALKAKMDTAGEEITRARLALGSLESDGSNLDRILTRAEAYTRELNEEYQLKELLLNQLTAEKEQLQSGGYDLIKQMEEKEGEKAELEELLQRLQEEKREVMKYLSEIRQKKEALDLTLSGFQGNKHELELKLAKNETQVEGYKEKLWEDFEVSYVQAVEFRKQDFVLSQAVKESRDLKNRMKDLGEVNIGAIKEYETVKERYDFLSEQRQDLLSAIDSLVEIIEDMDKNIRRSFHESFEQIRANFEKTFQAMFGGGTAELVLEDAARPLESGIDIIAQPPGKKLQNINLLSGGEKTMTAIALMFAVLRAKPTPFCILDEIEAALDDANIQRVAKYLRDFKEIQFALITHQKATMEYADALYGVTMPEQGISKVISLKLGDTFDL